MEIRGSFVSAADALQRATVKGTTDACEFVLADADEHAPLETGALVRSGDYDVESDGEGGAEGSVYYDTVYARRQHEELDWEHDPGREAKWLERSFNRNASKIEAIIGTSIRTEMR